MIRSLLMGCILLSLVIQAQAQDVSPTEQYLSQPIEERSFDPDSWRSAKEGIDFRDEVRVDRYDEDFSDEEGGTESQQRRQVGGGSSSPVMGFIFKALLVVGAIALLGFLLSRFLGAGGITLRKNRRIDSSMDIDIEQIEEELIESDVDRLLRLALEDENYPMALRLKYLTLIKSLFLNGYTRWKKDKTNRQYIREITDEVRREEFQKLTLTYERIWYGSGIISKMDYEHIEPAFADFLNKIQANPIKIIEPV